MSFLTVVKGTLREARRLVRAEAYARAKRLVEGYNPDGTVKQPLTTKKSK